MLKASVTTITITITVLIRSINYCILFKVEYYFIDCLMIVILEEVIMNDKYSRIHRQDQECSC